MVNFSALFYASIALNGYVSASPILQKRIAQTIADSTADWVKACRAAGGADKCGTVSQNAFMTLLAAGKACDQQDAADAMIDLAKTLNNDAEIIRLTQLFVQQPRNAPDSLQVPYCQTAPKNAELNGLFHCQFQGTVKNGFSGDQTGNTPLGVSAVNPPGSCPAKTDGPVPDGVQLNTLVKDPGVGSSSTNSNSGASSNSTDASTSASAQGAGETSVNSGSSSVASSNSTGVSVTSSAETASETSTDSSDDSSSASSDPATATGGSSSTGTATVGADGSTSTDASSTDDSASTGNTGTETVGADGSTSTDASSIDGSASAGTTGTVTTGADGSASTDASSTDTAVSTSSTSSSGSGDFQKQNGEDALALQQKFASLTADSPCNDGEDACVGGGFAQCVGGKFAITQCAGGTQCFALPLVNKPGTSIACTTQDDFDARIKASGNDPSSVDSGSGAGDASATSSAETGGETSTASSGDSSSSDTASSTSTDSAASAGSTDTGSNDGSAASGSTSTDSASSLDSIGSVLSSSASGFQKQNGEDALALQKKFASLTADSSCNEGESACVQGGFAQCIGGKFSVTQCSGGTKCFALPLVNKPGTSIACTTQDDFDARIKASGASA